METVHSCASVCLWALNLPLNMIYSTSVSVQSSMEDRSDKFDFPITWVATEYRVWSYIPFKMVTTRCIDNFLSRLKARRRCRRVVQSVMHFVSVEMAAVCRTIKPGV